MLNRQNCEKWGKTGISKRVIKALFVNVYGKFQFSVSQNNVNFVVGGLKHKPGIFTIYASGVPEHDFTRPDQTLKYTPPPLFTEKFYSILLNLGTHF